MSWWEPFTETSQFCLRGVSTITDSVAEDIEGLVWGEFSRETEGSALGAALEEDIELSIPEDIEGLVWGVLSTCRPLQAA